jgi:uncharacterized protein (DUF1778 family)
MKTLKAPDDIRDVKLTIAFSTNEMAKIDTAADRMGINRTAFFRIAITRAANEVQEWTK